MAEGQPIDYGLWRKLASLVSAEIETFGDAGPPVLGRPSKVLPVTGQLRSEYESTIQKAMRATDMPGLMLFVPPSLVHLRKDWSGFAVYRSFRYSRDEDTEFLILHWDRNLDYSTEKLLVPAGYLFAGTAVVEDDSLRATLQSGQGGTLERIYEVRSGGKKRDAAVIDGE